MIKVVKGDMELTIPTGAYKMYASAGWHKAEDSTPDDNTQTSPEPETKDEDLDNNQPEETNESEETFDEEGEEDSEESEEVEYVDPEELLKKPLGELDFEELQIVAEYLGINTEGLTNSKKLRAAIKAAQK